MRSGRRKKVAQRAAPTKFDPCPPGAIGGQYKPLSETEVTQVYDTAVRLLSELGMGEVPERLTQDLLNNGATISGERILFPPKMIERAIKTAPKQFTLHGRDPNRSIHIGGDRVHFGTGGAAVQTLDIDTAQYRPSTLEDLHHFTRLQDALRNVSWFTRCCVATDVPDNFDLDVNTVFALLKNTTKPVATSFTIAPHVAPIVRMLDIAAGGEGEFAKRPFLKAHISPVISPLRYAEDAVDVVYECIKHNIPMSCITAAQAGATAPATLAGILTQSLAETLASLVMVQGETAVLNAASAQVSNWLGLPSGVASSMTDAKAIDAQYGMEKGMTSIAAALSGGNLIYESSGMTASLLGASFEGFVLDDEMHSNSYRALRGIEVNDATLGFETICEAVLGEGHFLGKSDTYAAMERDYFYPDIADRNEPRTWAETGATSAWERANLKAKNILAEHKPAYLTDEQERAIRAEFNILY
ncbi:MAG: trimethylamine methyltransferase [Rhodobacteraceae bacterium]|nr:trimethylamine methyltransferase [Paracoccaceae bacterium]